MEEHPAKTLERDRDLRGKLGQLKRRVWAICEGAAFEEVLASCNLNTSRALYLEIDRATARAYLKRIFYGDLAYARPEMEPDEAGQLAELFLAEFPSDESQYYSNGTATAPHEHGRTGMVELRSWNPVGTATFDWGVVVVSPQRAGCVWAEDED